MDIFLSAEGYAQGITFWNPLQKEFSAKLAKLRNSYYGSELTSIAIISIIFPPEFFSDGGFRERSLFHRKTCEADIRLRIDFYEFVHAKPEKRREIYKQHICDSLLAIKRKLPKSFLFDQLYSDVINAIE